MRVPKSLFFLLPRKSEWLLEQDLYVDPDYFKSSLAGKYLLGISKKRVKVSELRLKNDKGLYPLYESPVYKYLVDREKNGKTDELYENLIQNIEKKGFNPKSYIICKWKNNVIKDGRHRSVYLLWKYGPDYELDIVHVHVRTELLRFKLCPWLKKLT